MQIEELADTKLKAAVDAAAEACQAEVCYVPDEAHYY
jgi:hypothetical protein